MAEAPTTARPCAGVAKARRPFQVSGTRTMRPDERGGQLLVQAGLFLEPTTDNTGRLSTTSADVLRFQGHFHRIPEDEPLLLLDHSASGGKPGWLAITATTQCGR